MKKSIFILVFIFSCSLSFSQELKERKYEEQIDDPYIYKSRASFSTSPAYQKKTPEIFTTQVNIDEHGNNILGDAANEPSIAISPLNPDQMVIGWRQFTSVDNNFRQAGYAYTSDGGQNWTFPEPIEEGNFRSDPVLDVNTDGTFYYNSLSIDNGNYYCDVFKSDSGETWDSGKYAFGGDKQWMVIDRTTNSTSGNIYAFWKQGLSSCQSRGFTRSRNNATSFDGCSVLPVEMTRGTMAVGPEGELYICGHISSNHYIAKSSDPGNIIIEWDLVNTVDLGGRLSLYQGPNPSGMLGQVWVATDHSSGPTRGNVYMLSTVENTESGDMADITFSKSVDGGETWSSPIIINDDGSVNNWQWFGTISVAPNGRIDVAWVDTREDPNGYNSALNFSYSIDGGDSWSSNISLSESFNPHLGFPNQNKIGDYYHMISDEEGAHLAWAATFNGEQDIYYSNIKIKGITKTNDSVNDNFVNISPNPSDGIFNIHFDQFNNDVSITVYNSLGKTIQTIASNNNQDLMLDITNEQAGIYFIKLQSDDMSTVRKVILE